MVTLRTAAAVIGLFGAWELFVRVLWTSQHVLAAPTSIVARIASHLSLYGRNLAVTLGEAAWGFLWGNLAALFLAAVVAVLPLSERLILRVALVVYCLPLVATGPVLRVIYGPGQGPQITLAAMAVYYTTLVPLLVGLRAVPQSWNELVATYGRGRFTALMRVRLRACLPYLFAGLQVAVPAAFLGAVIGEFTGASRGLGVLSIYALRGLDPTGVWSLAVVASVVSALGFVFFGWLGRILTGSRPANLLLSAAGNRARPAAGWRAVRSVGEVVLAIVATLALWAGAIRLFHLDHYFARGPLDVWRYLFTDPGASGHRSELLGALSSTLGRAGLGYLVGLLFGVLMALVLALTPAVRRVATPVAVALRCVPIVTVTPLLITAFGRGVAGTTVLVAALTFFPTFVACTAGLDQAPGQVLDFFASYGTSPVRTLLTARLPAIAPAFFAAARIAVPASLLAATVAEWLATGTGIGNLMVLASAESAYGTLWACVAVLTAVAVAAYGFVALIEHAVLSRVAAEQTTW